MRLFHPHHPHRFLAHRVAGAGAAWRAAIRTGLLALILVGAPAPALRAASDEPRPEEVARIDILPGWRMADGRQMAALRIRLADGWKTYWRAPGDSGIPPAFDWSGSRNLGAVAFRWPVPQVIESRGLQTIGYKHELILPMELTPAKAGAPIEIQGKVALGVCRDVCMPMEARLDATLPARREDPAAAAAIRAALADQPLSPQSAGGRVLACDVAPIADGLRVRARLKLPPPGGREVAVMEAPRQEIWVSPAEIAREGDVLTVVSDMVAPSGQPFALSRSDIRITVLSGRKAVDFRGCVARP